MAFNWQTFWTRAFTALIFVAVMMTGLLYNNWSFFLLFTVIHFGCWWEYFKLVEKILKIDLHPYIKIGWSLIGFHVVLFFVGNHIKIGDYGLQHNFSLPILFAGIVLWVLGIFKANTISKAFIFRSIIGMVYISVSIGMICQLAIDSSFGLQAISPYFASGAKVLMLIIGSVWINDTLAYLVGSMIGKTPLSKISPKKTWEGTIGGIILSAAITWVLYQLVFFKIVDNSFAIIGIIVSVIAAITGTIGDLYESKLKRMAGVKDSGSIMPGHGGFLDRFDSLLFAGPAVWLFFKLCLI